MVLLGICPLEVLVAGGVTVTEGRRILVKCVELAQVDYLSITFLTILVVVELANVFGE